MRALACIVALGALTAPVAALAGVDKVDGPIPVTADSQVYNTAWVPGALPVVDLAARGYVEEEYFLHGTADAFKRDPAGALAVLAKDVPYGTRIVVRRPKDAAKFSGVVHFEPIHPSQGGTSHWVAMSGYMMAHGDVYVAVGLGDDAPSRAISAKGPVPTAQSQVLQWFEPQRYGAIQWPKEDGIRYQVMADIGALLRSDRAENPLRGLDVRRMLVGGWSFTGSVQRTFINEGFHDRARLPSGKPVFDGYLIGISSRWNGGGYIPLNSEEAVTRNDDPRRSLKPIDVPVIEFMTEFEVGTGPGPQLPDSDAKVGAHRLYQLGAVVHGASMIDGNPPRERRPNFVQLAAKGYPVGGAKGEEALNTCPLPISDVPHGALARAAVENLRQWTEKGVAPPRAQPLAWDGDKIRRDATGNPVGGLPVAEFKVPLASYGPYKGTDLPACTPAKGRPIFVRTNLDAATLKARYGTVQTFVKRYDAQVDAMVAQRWLLPEDAAMLKAKARRDAEAQFAAK
ncbi:alpha/beta hydrolase domain-containing protein [Novosphingobium sp.]|uniref:alpha/beta hydrolase domain-containing protein n=1 Tax=Novosphingobium sp. TaxID=1874826 RepID=UPI0028B03B0A|nr:alpha/beta hydrolase domain-containing protein [Novosphingobium sp.]